jgi:hypothetical protein
MLGCSGRMAPQIGEQVGALGRIAKARENHRGAGSDRLRVSDIAVEKHLRPNALTCREVVQCVRIIEAGLDGDRAPEHAAKIGTRQPSLVRLD